ncbi:MAG: MucB/RseB C-terminal domain-containing protein [Azoarcus sp.]|jgi:sigma-E factor negative regulatory protein RseB|nr:MucB/RseB C-terminal domain-containing protein [Azoarcus sp.]
MIATKPWLVLLWLGVLCSPVAGQTPVVTDAPSGVLAEPAPANPGGSTAEPFAWIERIAAASQRLNYVGTFSYQTGRRFETSRIAHRYAGGEESERLEVLDGSPREVVRRGNTVYCLLPAQRTEIISRAGVRSGFPGRLQSDAELPGSYDVRLGEMGRIAGYEARKVVFEPHDGLRFGHVLWAETQSGLLLKSQVVDANGAVVEQFAFSDVHIGGEVSDDLLVAHAQPQPDWRVIEVGSDDAGQTKERWRFRKPPLPGFVLVSKVSHHKGGIVQMVFSDGLAAISVFIEPAEAGIESRGGFPGGGAVNAFERIVDGQRITVLGEVPPRAVQQAAEAIEAVQE